MLPKITIITPSFNQGKYLEQTITSVLNQNYPNLEYIIIDGGSTDNSVEIIKKYTSKLAFWLSEPDMGQTDAINKGLKIATGEIFSWLNSDDFYEPNSLFKIGEYFLKNQSALIICGKCNVFNESEGVLRITQGIQKPSTLAEALANPVINQPETFFRKLILEKTGLPNPKLRYNMDKDLLLKYYLNWGISNIHFIDTTIANFRLHSSSKTVENFLEFTKERDSLLAGMIKYLENDESANFICNQLKIRPIEFKIPNHQQHQSDAYLHYYYLLKADESFVNKDYKQMKAFISKINPIKIKNRLRIYLSLWIKQWFYS
jgi:glycosyltransferase involved in cell wall biosynthesis